MKNTTVLLVDDHSLMRDGLRVLLEREQGVTVVGEASTGRQAVEMVKELSPEIVVMDLRMPDLNGLDAARQAIAAKPKIKIIGLSGVSDEKMAAGMLKVGAVGYVAKESAYDELATAIRTVISGKVYFDPSIIARAASPEADGGSSAFTELSPREREVLQLIAEGKATKQIAIHLHVSVKTAETHRRNIMEKLGVDGVAELTKYAIREGLTSV